MGSYGSLNGRKWYNDRLAQIFWEKSQTKWLIFDFVASPWGDPESISFAANKLISWPHNDFLRVLNFRTINAKALWKNIFQMFKKRYRGKKGIRFIFDVLSHNLWVISYDHLSYHVGRRAENAKSQMQPMISVSDWYLPRVSLNESQLGEDPCFGVSNGSRLASEPMRNNENTESLLIIGHFWSKKSVTFECGRSAPTYRFASWSSSTPDNSWSVRRIPIFIIINILFF